MTTFSRKRDLPLPAVKVTQFFLPRDQLSLSRHVAEHEPVGGTRPPRAQFRGRERAPHPPAGRHQQGQEGEGEQGEQAAKAAQGKEGTGTGWWDGWQRSSEHPITVIPPIMYNVTSPGIGM